MAHETCKPYNFPDNIKVTVVNDLLTMNKFLQGIISKAEDPKYNKDNPCLISLDTEQDDDGRVVLLQLYIDDLCLLIRMLDVQAHKDAESESGTFCKLKELFLMPNVIFVGSGIYECDILKLCPHYFICDVNKVHWLDTQDVAHYLVWIHVWDECDRPGLAGLAKQALHYELDKGEQCSDWTAELSDSQIHYAVCDAVVAIDIVRKLYELTCDCDKSGGMDFGPWIWTLQRASASCFHNKHSSDAAVCMPRFKEKWKGRAFKLFKKMDKNGDGILNNEELINEARWFWKRLNPGKGEAPDGAYTDLVKQFLTMRPGEYGWDSQKKIYAHFAEQMTEANRIYHTRKAELTDCLSKLMPPGPPDAPDQRVITPPYLKRLSDLIAKCQGEESSEFSTNDAMYIVFKLDNGPHGNRNLDLELKEWVNGMLPWVLDLDDKSWERAQALFTAVASQLQQSMCTGTNARLSQPPAQL